MSLIFLKKTSNLLYLTLITFLLGDVLRKLAIFYHLDFVRYTAVSKTIVMLTYFIFLAIYIKDYIKFKIIRKFIVLSVLLLVVFFLGQIMLNSNFSLTNILKGNLLYLSRYYFWPLTLILFLPLITSFNYKSHHLQFFTVLFIINIGFIILGLFFNIDVFKTYTNEHRFGFMGLYNTSNQASYYFILFLLFFYYQAFFKLKSYLPFIFTLLISFLIGTKKIYFFLVILLFYHIFKFKLYKKFKFYLLMTIIMVIVSLFYSKIKGFLFSKFKIFVNIYNEDGFITSITSFRDQLLLKSYNNLILESWTLPNFVFGGPIFPEYRIEFGVFDLYIFFGIIGIFAFCYFFKTLYQFTNHNKFYLFILISIGLTTFFSSGFLSDPNQPILFVLISGYFISEGSQFENQSKL